MREAKLIILNMVSEGKISADEAAKLIEVICREDSYNPDFANEQEKSTDFAEATDDLGAEIRQKIKGIYKDVEPHFRRTLLSALETATLISSTVQKSVNESIRDIE